jgi:integrase
MEFVLLDAAGHCRSPATMPGYHRGRPPRNKGERYPADPPTVEEIVAVMRAVGDRPDGHRLRALIVLLWRAGLRIGEALALQESDLDRGRGAVIVRRGKGGKRRDRGMRPGRPASTDRPDATPPAGGSREVVDRRPPSRGIQGTQRSSWRGRNYASCLWRRARR